jgi:uncharacterized protein YrrD
MRLTDVLELPVVDQNGRGWGQVHDIHLVQDGPILASGLAAFRAHGLIAGRGAFATRLGFSGRPGYDADRETRGPLALRLLVRRLHRRARYIPWSSVITVERDRVVVEAPSEGFALAAT